MTTVSLPDKFVQNTKEHLGTQNAEVLFDTLLNTKPVTAVRTNILKQIPTQLELTNPISWCANGFILNARPNFTHIPQLHAGAFYVQESSSMFVGEIVRKLKPNRALDLCAAPGGKSTHISSVIPKHSILVANEVIRPRATILAENVQKWGQGNTIVTSSDAVRFGRMGEYFDLIVVDAPCSGEGMFRKDPQSREQWSWENVNLCADRSRRIVADVWPALQTGGQMIYSTCTFNRLENEETVQWICKNLGAEVVQIQYPQGAMDTGFGAHFFPHLVQGEGLYVALLQKTQPSEDNQNTNSYNAKAMKTPLAKLPKPDTELLKQWIGNNIDANAAEKEFRIGGNAIWAYGEQMAQEIDYIMNFVSVIYSGIEMGVIYHNELKPAHALSLAVDCVFTEESHLDYDEAINFLKKGTLSPNVYKNGVSRVMFEGVGLGWAKGIAGKRVNSLYPAPWRILK